ncbi:MAG: DUF349 domain-containing protein [Bacteroidota bacterium]
MENQNELSALPEENKSVVEQVINKNEIIEEISEKTERAISIDNTMDDKMEIDVPDNNISPVNESVIERDDQKVIIESETPIVFQDEAIEEIEIEPLENFNGYTKEELTKRMEEMCQETDLIAIRNKVTQARESFNHIITQEKAAALSKFLEEGKTVEEFEFFADSTEEKFRKAYSKYSKLKADFIIGQEKLREENLKTKQEILSKMKNIIQNEENMSKAFNEFHELQAQWRNIGAVPQANVTELWNNYKLYIDRFYDFIKINRELQVLDQKKNVEMKLHLCEQAEELILETSLNKAINQAQALQNKWKEIGFVMREQGNELWTRFRIALDKVYENKKQYLAELQKKHNDNYIAKLELCEQAQTIANAVYEQHNQWQDGMKSLLEIQVKWRTIGPADRLKNEEVWKKFKSIADGFFKQKDEYYKKRKQEFATNLQAKTEICIQAEGLQENSDWKATSDELIRLQQEWKKYGHVGSQDKNNKIWIRFKAACDVFFNRKKAHYASIDDEYEKNYSKKVDLISRIEKFVVNKDDAAESLDQLKLFQREWSEIGMVPLKKKDKLWEQFRSAIKVHFDVLQLRPDFKQGGTVQLDKGISSKSVSSSDERNILNKMTKLKEEVSQLENNIEFFAKSKGTSVLKQQFEKKIQDTKDEIAKLKTRLKAIKSAE